MEVRWVGSIVRVSYRYLRPLTVVYVRCTGPYEASARAAWQLMGNWLDRRQARTRVKQAFGLMRDNPMITAPELLRYDACVSAVFGIEADEEAGIHHQTLLGGAYAVYTHIGAYDETGQLFSDLRNQVVPKRGLSIDYDRPFLVTYLNDPLITRGVHRRTELCVPVLPVRMPVSNNDDQSTFDAGRSLRRAVGQLLDSRTSDGKLAS